MNKTGKIIIISIVILIILLVILLMIYFNIKDELTEEDVKNNYDGIEKLQIRKEIRLLDSYNQYYSILKCINEYYANIAEKKQQEIYDVLDSKYINQNQITIENILQKVDKPESANIEYHIEDIRIQEGEKISKYYIKGVHKEIGTTYFIYYLDNYNATYSIFPINVEIYNNVIQYGHEEENEIKINNNNQYEVVTVNSGIIVTKLLEDYKYNIENNIQKAYSCLEKEYREKKFNNINEYKRYVDNLDIKNANLKKYQKRETDEYVEYIGIDDKGRCYTFRETAVMEYSVILDTYTIDLPEFLEKYNKSKDEIKVGMNIQKVFDAINDGDYRYAYKKLNNTFKANNFKTEQEFEAYVKTNFYTKNTVKYNRCQKNGEIYSYNITLTDTTDTNKKNVEKTIIMHLKEGTNFVMSFNV